MPKIERTSGATELAFSQLGNYFASPLRNHAPATETIMSPVVTLTDSDDVAD